MELYLLKDELVKFIMKRNAPLPLSYHGCRDYPLILEPVALESEESKAYCKIIASQAIKGSNKKDFKLLGQKWRLDLTLPRSASDQGTLRMIQTFREDMDEEERYRKCGTAVYQVMKNLFRKNLSFHLTIEDLEIKYSCNCNYLVRFELESIGQGSSLLFKNIKFPHHQLHPEATMEGRLDLRCRMTLVAKLNWSQLANIPLEWMPTEKPANKCRRLLEEEIGSDLVIVAANGAEVKCHKCHLMVSCDAFRAMFENKMVESNTNRLEMPNMSEAGVRAFLHFIYTSELEALSETCDIAFELFQAGDKYGMLELKNRMKTLICSKPPYWFNVDMAVQCFLLAHNLEEKDILNKVGQALRSFPKRTAELLASEEYKKLFRNNPQVEEKLNWFLS